MLSIMERVYRGKKQKQFIFARLKFKDITLIKVSHLSTNHSISFHLHNRNILTIRERAYSTKQGQTVKFLQDYNLRT